MKNIRYAFLYESINGCGLTNQIFIFVSHIIKSILYTPDINIIIYNNFLTDINNLHYINSLIPISNIINIDEFNKYLYDKYNILIFDKNYIDFNIISAYYGMKDKNVDITQFIKNNCFDPINNKLFISNKLNLNELFGDPTPGQVKKIFIKYLINGYEFEIEYDENCSNLREIVEFNLTKVEYQYYFKFPFDLDDKLFFDILKNIPFKHNIIIHSDKFIKHVNENINNLKLNNLINNKLDTKINVIHLRTEDDGIKHWSNQNNMTDFEFKYSLENKYIDIIKKETNNNIDKNNIFIILSYTTDNNVIKYLNDNNYIFFICNKYLSCGREINAIIDLLNTRICNNLFIGNLNIKQKRGSSFSYFILSKLNKINNIKSILIDLDNIKSEENEIYYDYTPEKY